MFFLKLISSAVSILLGMTKDHGNSGGINESFGQILAYSVSDSTNPKYPWLLPLKSEYILLVFALSLLLSFFRDL